MSESETKLESPMDDEQAICRFLHRRVSFALRIAWLLLTTLGLQPQKLFADDAPPPIAYRRIYVPANKIDVWPRADEKFIPIESKDFEKLVSAANHETGHHQPTAVIDSAEYIGQIDSDGHLRGQGRWSISVEDGKPAFLQLPNLSFLIREPRWQSGANLPVQIGAWGETGGEPKRFGVRVPKTGVIEFKWDAQSRSSNDEVDVAWKVPPATKSRLILDLPDGMQPEIAGGAVLRSEAVKADSKDAKAKQYRHWVLALSPSVDATLHLASTKADKIAANEQPELREEVQYQLEERGLEINASWNLTRLTAEQHELTVPLSNGVQLTSVTSDGRELNWHVNRGLSSAADKATIDLAGVGDSPKIRITVNAWKSLILGRSWQLPVLHPEAVFWSAGTFALAISPELELHSVTPTDCGQDDVIHLGADGATPESLSFSAYTSAAALDVVVARRQPEVTVRAGSSLALADTDVTCRLVTEWSATESGTHRLLGELAPGWNIDAVETTPSDALAEWFIHHQGDRRNIEVELTRSPRQNRSIYVTITGRLQRANFAEPLTADTLRIVHWNHARVGRHLLSFQTTEPFITETFGDIPTLGREQISDSDRMLLDRGSDEKRIVDLARAGPTAGLQLVVKRGQYTAEVSVDAICAGNELRQNLHISARPTANPIDRLMVYSTASLGDHLHWFDSSTNAPIAAERLPPNDPQRANFPKDGELWLLRLPQPTSNLVEISAAAINSATNRTTVSLITLPEAIDQHGFATVRSGVNASPWIDSQGMDPVPTPITESASSEDRAPVRATFRYAPNDCLDIARTPRLWISSNSGNGAAPLTIRQLDLESFYRPDGRASHRATYDLQNNGAAEFKPGLPRHAHIAAIYVGDDLIEVPNAVAANHVLTIQISPNERSAKVTVYFETQEAGLSTGSSIQPPFVENGTSILSGEWSAWLPNEFVGGVAGQSGDSQYHWRNRIFGPLARSTETAPFNLLQAAEWSRAIGSISDEKGRTPETTNHAIIREEDSQTHAAPTRIPANPESFDKTSLGETAASSLQTIEQLNPDLSGWHPIRQTFVAAGSVNSIVVSRPDALSSRSLGGMLVTFFLAWRFCLTRKNLLLFLAFVSACLALTLPMSLAPLATGAFWGLAFSTLGFWPRYSIGLRSKSHGGTSRAAVASCLALLVVAAVANRALAQPDQSRVPPNESSPDKVIERVLIPLDSDNHPVGTKWFISERLLRELTSAAPTNQMTADQWFLRDAVYSGELSENRTQSETSTGNWSLAFTIEVLARDSTVVLPLNQTEAAWQPAAMLDGVPVPIAWSEDAHHCSIVIAEPGSYTLTLFCAPKATSTNGRSQLSLSIPPLVPAHVQVHSPKQFTGVEIAGALIGEPTKDEPGVVSAELAKASQLVVSWSPLEQKNSANQGLNLTELDWLHVGTNGIELDSKYVIEGGAHRPDLLTVKYDSCWTSLETPTASEDQQADNSDLPQTLRIPLATEDTERQEVTVRWKLKRAPAAGNLRLPPMRLLSPPPTQRWFALSADAALDCTIADNSASATTAKEFLGKWGSSLESASPQIALSNVDADRDWIVAVRPRESESVVRDVIHLAAGLTRARVVYQANVTPGSSNRFQFQVAVPKELSIEDVTLAEADRQISTRWTRDSRGNLNVFFGNAVRSDYRLTVNGFLPIAEGATIGLPRISAGAAASGTQQVQLYRDDNVDVKLSGFSPTDEVKAVPSELPPIQWLVRPIGVYRLDEAASHAAGFAVTPKQNELSGDTCTSLTREGNTWWVSYAARVESTSGDIDTVQLRFPTSCVGPFEVESSTPATTTTSAFDGHSQTLAIRFTKTIQNHKEITLQVRSQVVVPGG
ncbi:MAG TPA: hypothetical protein VHU84_11310, partial [Lacipirellulaceae bacterium]|nr:hypothetical protein [Lacipirellulaceae bacterium]